MRARLAAIPHRRRLLLGYGAAAAFSFAVCAVLFTFPAVTVLEWRLVDHWAQKAFGKRVSRTVAVAGIDEALLDRHGWPLEKDLYGDLVSFLSDMGAAAIAFDIVFADNLDACGKGDSVFRAIVGLVPDVVFGYGAITGDSYGDRVAGKRSRVPERFALGPGHVEEAEIRGAVLPYESLLNEIGALGFFSRGRPFADGVDRQMPLFMSQDSLLYPSFALVALTTANPRDTVRWDRRNRTAHIGDRRIPVDCAGKFFVSFVDSIPVYPLSDLEESHRAWLKGEEPRIGREAFEGRIVFVGNTALSLGDFGVTPLSGRQPEGRSPNVLLHAWAAATLLEGNAIHGYGRRAGLLVSAVLVVAGIILFLTLPAQAAVAGAALLLTAALVAGERLFLVWRLVPVLEGVSAGVIFTVAGSLVAYFEKDFDRRRLHELFRHYLSPHIIDDMYRRRINPELGGAEVNATAFFTDIENFSTFSEDMKPTELVGALNEYFRAMTRILLECNGTLDKFIGDAIVAFFGAPGVSRTHAYDACAAAVRMQETLRDLRLKWHGDPAVHRRVRDLRMRIGINTGTFITGNVGCEIRMNYTMMGDTVNLASRLEGAAKNYGVYTVVGEETARGLREPFLFRKLDRIQVKGRAGAVDIYQLMGFRTEKDGPTLRLIELYEEAFEAYRAMDFAAAARMFRVSLEAERFPGEKNPSSIMLDRCERLLKRMPDSWDGIFRPEGK